MLERWIITIAALTALTPSARADEGPMHAVMADQLRYNDARVILGRVVLTTDDPTRKVEISTHGENREEKLSVSSHLRAVSLTYERTTDKSRLKLVVDHATRVEIHRDPIDSSDVTALEFLQPDEGPLTLVVGQGQQRHEWHGPTLWHLWLEHEAVCDSELKPLLQLLRPDWNLAYTAERLERAMLDSANHRSAVERQAVSEWIRQLSSDEYARREQADRELRSLGLSLLPVVQSIDRTQLDAEQAFRLRRIMADNAGELKDAAREDSAERAARWMVGDPQAWLALMARSKMATRLAAAQQLSQLLGEPVEFDARASQATRDEQLSAIRQQVERLWKF